MKTYANLLLSLVPCLLALTPSGFGSTMELTLNVAADAYVSQDEPWASNGAADRLFATEGMDTESSEKIYLLFDASELAGDVVDIVDFQAVFTNQYGGREGHAFLLTGPGATEWTESTINYDNAPANDPLHFGFLESESTHLGLLEPAEQDVTASFEWVEEDKESLKATVIDALNSGDRKIALGIHRNSTNRNISYASRENTSNHGPRLILEILPDIPVETTHLGVAEDAHVNQALPDLNFGADVQLFATQGVASEDSEKIYLKFDASGLPSDVIQVVDIQAVFLNHYGRFGTVYLLTESDANDWSEGSITYNNAPANDYFDYGFLFNESRRLGELDLVEAEQTAGFYWFGDMQEVLLEALNSGDRTVTLGVARNSTNRNLSYASRENEEHHQPRLVLLTERTEGSAGFDDWLNQHFTSEQLDDPSISGPEADPAGDNLSNLLKYALGLNPWTPSAHLLPKPRVELIDEVAYLILRFTRPDAIDDINFSVEAFGDLNSTANAAVQIGAEPVGDGIIEYAYRDTTPVESSERRFLRIRVTRN